MGFFVSEILSLGTLQCLQGDELPLKVGAALSVIGSQFANLPVLRSQQRLTRHPQEIYISAVQRLA